MHTNSVQLPQAEFDFRGLLRFEPKNVIYYEHARSCDWLIDAVNQWHQRVLVLPEDDGSVEDWRGLTIGQVLRRGWNEAFPHQVEEAVWRSIPSFFFEPPLDELLKYIRVFPTRFVDIPAKERAAINLAALNGHSPPQPFRIVAEPDDQRLGPYWAWNDPKERERRAKLGIHLITVAVDLRCPKTSVCQAACKEMASLYKDLDNPGIRKFPVVKGKAAGPKWHELKELGAYRLHKHGKLTWEKAQFHLEDLLDAEQVKPEAVRNIWPLYKSAGGWNGAIESVYCRIRELFPQPA
jgi:hypothetical protein